MRIICTSREGALMASKSHCKIPLAVCNSRADDSNFLTLLSSGGQKLFLVKTLLWPPCCMPIDINHNHPQCSLAVCTHSHEMKLHSLLVSQIPPPLPPTLPFPCHNQTYFLLAADQIAKEKTRLPSLQDDSPQRDNQRS